MKNLNVLVLLVSIVTGAAYANAADTFADKCGDIAGCAKVVGDLLGQKYVFDADVRGKIMATPNLALTKENAELLFTDMLNLNGFSRVPTGVPETYQIMRERDARDMPIPLLAADQKTAPNLPNTWDLMTLRYKATHPEVVENIARTSRSFMPANSRIIAEEASGVLLLTDTAMNLKKLYSLIQDMDQKPTPEMKKRWDEDQKARRAEMFKTRHEEAVAKAAQPQPATPAH